MNPEEPSQRCLLELVPLPDPKPPKRDLPAEVIAYFNNRVAETGVDAGHRKAIAARLAEIPGDDDRRVEICRRVIDVQASEARAAGECDGTKADRKRLSGTKGWKFFRISTMFRNAENFSSRLERWSEDGDHDLWGDPASARASPGSNRGARRSGGWVTMPSLIGVGWRGTESR